MTDERAGLLCPDLPTFSDQGDLILTPFLRSGNLVRLVKGAICKIKQTNFSPMPRRN